MEADRRPDRHASWIEPPSEEEGLSSYITTIRERLWLIVVAVVITTGVGLIYVVTADERYEAEASILVTPVPGEDEVLTSLGLPSSSSDPLREVQTVAQLVDTPEVAERAYEQLGEVPEAAGGPASLRTEVSAEPIAESNLVAITAEAGNPEHAAQIANAFAEGLVDERTTILMDRVDLTLTQLEASAEAGVGVGRQIASLERLRAQEQDPTLQIATEARPPSSAVSPRPLLTVAGSLVAGLVLGLGGAFALQALDPRLRREEQLRRLYRLPILARIPREPKRFGDRPLAPNALSPATAEAYRTLRGTMAASRRDPTDHGRVVLVTGSSPSEGKTTTAINLASSISATGKDVLLIEADLRRPAIGRALGIVPETGIVAVLTDDAPISEASRTTKTHGPNLKLLLAEHEGADAISELFALPAAERMVADARSRFDYVVIDSPPLTDVIDALPLTRYTDDVLIAVRLGKTRIDKLVRLGELLAETDIQPTGFALIGTRRPSRSDSRYYAEGRPQLFRQGLEAPTVPPSGARAAKTQG